tara:strand:+ start:149 stop:373 length:225 start_codon:yes stop_codon:yes gene_type:complete
MKVDCSKLANKGDLLSLLFTVILIGAVVLVVFLTTIDTFLAGFCSASLVWNWKRWIFTPLDTLLDALWPDNSGD